MTNHDKQEIEDDDILEEMEEEIEDIENEEWDIDDNKLKDTQTWWNTEVDKLKDLLARTSADFENFKKRVERDKADMIFFLKADIFKKILPRIDDLERIIENTPDDMKQWVLFEGILSLQKALLKDINKMWVKSFNSIWEEANPDQHDIMTQVPWKKESIIFDEFEKWYMLNDKVLRHAKVVVWAGE